jgi:hypothetical protein
MLVSNLAYYTVPIPGCAGSRPDGPAQKALRRGNARDIDAYSLNTLAAAACRFMVSPLDAPRDTPLADIVYAYQFDAVLYARYLRRYAQARGVKRIEGKVVGAAARCGRVRRGAGARERHAHRGGPVPRDGTAHAWRRSTVG